MAVPPLVALKAAGSAQKALTGDLYVKRWQTVKKRPKSKGGDLAVEHELHINPITVGVGLVGGVAVLGLAAYVGTKALKTSGYRVVKGANKTAIRIVRLYDGVYGDVEVIDTPGQVAWIEEVRDYHLVADPLPVAPALPSLPYNPTGEEVAAMNVQPGVITPL